MTVNSYPVQDEKQRGASGAEAEDEQEERAGSPDIKSLFINVHSN